MRERCDNPPHLFVGKGGCKVFPARRFDPKGGRGDTARMKTCTLLVVALCAATGAHADVKLVAYEPLSPSRPKAGAVVLEITPVGGAQGEQLADVQDLNGVVKSQWPVWVAPLGGSAPQAIYRVRVLLELAPGGAEKLAGGVSLRVGLGPTLQKLSYGTAVYAGPADRCAGAGCGSASPSYVARLDDLGLSAQDSSLAVGEKYALVSDVSNFALYRKGLLGGWLKVDLTTVSSELGWLSSELGDPVLAPAVNAGDGRINGAAKLFRAFWKDPGPKNYNSGFVVKKAPASALAVLPCDPAKPMYNVVNPPAGVTTKYNWPDSSCISDFYDNRVRYDRFRKRFWITSAGRNSLWGGSCVSAGANAAFDDKTCKAIDTMEYRPQFVAVSKTDNPLDGFWTYQAADEDADMPVFEVTKDFAIFGHNNSAKVWVYDADDMANGNPVHPINSPLPAQVLPAGGELPSQIGVAAGVYNIRVPKMRVPKQGHPMSGMSLVLVQASQGSKEITIQGLTRDSSKKLKVIPGATFSDGDQIDIFADQVYQGDYLYIANDTVADGGFWSSIIVRRIPVHLAKDGKSLVVEKNLAQKWRLGGVGLSYNYPEADVTDEGNLVVGWRATGNVIGAHARYAVLYRGEERFRDTAILRPSTANGDFKKTDFARADLDPDGHSVWLVHSDITSTVVAGAVAVYDQPPPGADLLANAKLVYNWVERCRGGQIARIFTGKYISGPEVLNLNTSGGVLARSISTPAPLHIVWACDQDKQTTGDACPVGTDILKVEHGATSGEGRVDFFCYKSQGVGPDYSRPGQHLSTESDSCPLAQPVHLVKGTKTDGVDPISAPGQHATYNLVDKRFFWSCGSEKKWETCHDDTTLVVIERDSGGNVLFDCRQIPAPAATEGVRVGEPFQESCNYDEVVHQIEGVLVGGVGELTNTSQFSAYKLSHPTSFKWRCGTNTPESVSCPASANLVRITRGPGRNVSFDCRKN
jgi:hypothetical protein